jgi:hypothetical protein
MEPSIDDIKVDTNKGIFLNCAITNHLIGKYSIDVGM